MDITNKQRIEQPILSIEAGDIPQVRVLEFEELEDLLQMIVSNTNEAMHVYHVERNEEHLYFNWIVLHDFYHFNGVPIVVFVRVRDKAPTRFIRFRPDMGKIDFVNKVDEPSAAYIKILKVKQLPFCLDLTF
ncbi:MAG: hypothetical protein LUQ65_00925 [Candidatus Helarchaeota archaeon]|nr:hypothetical protein [Candidatus Helarchaeota archaeon]